MTTEEIKQLRNKGLTLKQISLKAGITESAVSYRLKGKRTEAYLIYLKNYQTTEKRKSWRKKYYHTEKQLEYMKKYYNNNRKKLLIYQENYRRKHKLMEEVK